MNRVMTKIETDGLTIRPALPEEDWAVRALYRALHAFNAGLEPRFALAAGWEQVLAEHLNQERATGQTVTLLAWDGSEPVGLAMLGGHADSPLFRHRHWAELTALYVAPAARGTKVANRLLAAGKDWATARGYGEVRLYVTASNQRARHFYAKADFRPVQEIWTLDLDPTRVMDGWQSSDESNEAA